MSPPASAVSRIALPVAAARVAVAGCASESAGLLEALERLGYRPKTSLDLTLCETAAFVDDCAAVLMVVRRGDEQRAVRHCLRTSQRFAGSIIVVYLGEEAAFMIDVLDAGADDCVRPPVSAREVVARLRSSLRRRAAPKNRGFRHIGDLALDPIQMRIRAADQGEVALTAAQLQLLLALLRDAGAVVSRDRLMDEVLGEESESFDRTIDVLVCRLRKRLASIGVRDFVQTVPGVGYRLNPWACP